MKAICVDESGGVVTTDVPLSERPADGHLIIQMESCEINPGDKLFLDELRPHPSGEASITSGASRELEKSVR